MANVLVYGSFEPLRQHHLDLFRQARKKGAVYVAIVGAETDRVPVDERVSLLSSMVGVWDVRNANGASAEEIARVLGTTECFLEEDYEQ